MLDLFNDIPAFVAAAKAGSFSAAGRDLNLSRSAIGKAIARIEARLGVRLFSRTTRAQRLTEEGRAFLARCVRATDELLEGAAFLEAGRSSITGVLKVTMPVLYGRLKVAPTLLALACDHPQLTLELDLRDRRVSLVEEGFDLAVRSGSIGSVAGLSTCVVGRHATVLCAAPSLVERLGMPGSLDDLGRYDAIVYHRDGVTEPWMFPGEDGRQLSIEPASRIRAADLGIILDAAISGRGVAWLPDWLIEDALKTGRLIRLLPDLPARHHDIHLLWATAPILPARLQVAIAALTEASDT
ncbi:MULTISPECIES: LysR family transcriptional regulator [Paraburkholderia]|uniref:LysR family transcriptional regulator n=1 Tax=Paraburkholderia TaxID=1822464 RepID=UPI00224DEADF|nr:MULTISPECIES: LysR family transcriptional regulator [Paraburkholderia]MCX4155417.1 LysR family transcriptional regulator [Paraburkholderia aspalathi]MDN7164826.1 LysR family transcriptional regulator [Paraburkholderia sp. SECH2]MDQ6393312.1 LysR family transcriptional regulator [Paraburkholderia aspalathi]